METQIYRTKRNELLAESVIKGLRARNMTGYYAETKEDALQLALSLIPEGSRIAMGGCMSAHEIGLIDALKAGNYDYVDRDAIDRREALLPYILECARRVSEEDYTLMRPLVFDFPADGEALRQDCEFMFGPDYLVCPVTAPKVTAWKVYLPVNEGGWEDVRDGSRYEGGRYYEVPVDLEDIPVFKKI